MSWRSALGRASAQVVWKAAKRGAAAPSRRLSDFERRALTGVFGDALDLDVIELRENITGLLNLSGRAFVIENTLLVPTGYLPLRTSTLVHEATHVWQFQHGGYAYIGDSLYAQSFGEGYDLARALRARRGWAALNCEQQATLIELAFEQGCFQGRPFVLEAVDYSGDFEAARAALHAGEGAPA
jgi:hypothetical protein